MAATKSKPTKKPFGRAVANPYLAQLRAFPSQLFRGTRPMTLFLVSGEVPLDRMALAEKESHHWLLSAWQRYERNCSL